MHVSDVDTPFRLERWFAILGLLSIMAWAAASATVLTSYVRAEMLARDAEITREVLESTIASLDVPKHLEQAHSSLSQTQLGLFFSEIASMENVFRALVYNAKKHIVWSSAPLLEGDHVGPNEELDEAMEGKLEFEVGRIAATIKKEHATFPVELEGREFVEIYVPVFSADREVVGVIEIYRHPAELMATLRQFRSIIWATAIAGGLFLYLVLFWLVRRAARIIRVQQKHLVESRALSTVGELTPVIAHNIRNPLASIRSSAELGLEERDFGEIRESFGEILERVDQADRWIGDLLVLSSADSIGQERLEVSDLVEDCLQSFAKRFQERGIGVVRRLEAAVPARGNGAGLAQVIYCLLDNAVDAMGDGGDLYVSVERDPARHGVTVRLRDTGDGIPRELLDRLFKPFSSTKQSGSGLGLALSRRLVEAWGGHLDLANAPERGAVATVFLPAWEG